jgi:hypothetical protein
MTPELNNNYANEQALILREAINTKCSNDICA